MVRLEDGAETQCEKNLENFLGLHPLLIDHIAEKILGYVDHNKGNLLACRRVCRLWNGISSQMYKAKTQVEVGSYSTSVPRFRKLIKISKSGHNPAKSNLSCIFGRFRLCQEVFQPIYSSVITDFFQTFQHSLESLDIWLDLRSSLLDVPIHTKSKLCHFPNLKTLVYDDRRVVLEGSQDVRGVLLKTIVKLAPSLETLSIRFQRDFRGSMECSSETVLSNVRNIFNNVQLKKRLRFLKLDMHLNDSMLNSLEGAALNLETLQVAIRGSHFAFPVFHDFLQSVQLTLKKLRFTYIERDSCCLIDFPKMSSLQEFEVDGTDAFSKHSVSFGEFSYLHTFPQLTTLKINIWAQSNLRWSQFFITKRPVPTIQELRLPGELCDVSMMSCVATIFPNLKRLQISVYSLTLDSLPTVFQSMTQLEELTVTKFPSLWDRSEKNVDHIFTGMRIGDCDKIREGQLVLSSLSEDELHTLKVGPGLTDMKSLKKLMMPDLQYQASYTDITGYLAFLRMPNLKHLNVGRSYLSNMCLGHLATKFPQMEEQCRLPPAYFKEPDDDDDGSFLDLPGDTCVYL